MAGQSTLCGTKKTSSSDGQNGNQKVEPSPPVRLQGEELKACTKANSVTIKLWSEPQNKESATYEITIPVLDGTETVWQLLHWTNQYKRVLEGQYITEVPSQYNMAERLMTAQPLAVFHQKMEELSVRTPENLEKCLRAVTEYMLPKRALQHQKCYPKRHCRKPLEMLTREWIAGIENINHYLVFFPPYGEGNKLVMDDLLEIAYYGIPNAWKNEMIRQNFDAFAHTLSEFIEFCERIEQMEGKWESQKVNRKPKTAKETPHKTSKSAKNKCKNPDKDVAVPACPIHGPGHSAEKCTTIKCLKAEAAERKKNFQGSKNKTWTRKQEEKKDEKQKSFVQKLIRSEIAALAKAGTLTKPTAKVSNADSELEDEEIHVLESKDIQEFQDLSLFEGEDMEVSV